MKWNLLNLPIALFFFLSFNGCTRTQDQTEILNVRVSGQLSAEGMLSAKSVPRIPCPRDRNGKEYLASATLVSVMPNRVVVGKNREILLKGANLDANTFIVVNDIFLSSTAASNAFGFGVKNNTELKFTLPASVGAGSASLQLGSYCVMSSGKLLWSITPKTAENSITAVSRHSSGLTAVLSASRTSGVAPLAVYFDASETESDLYSKKFHHLQYNWDFGDSGSKRPSATGPIAAHLFETPGIKTVELTVRDLNGTLVKKSIQINVKNPNTVYAGANTVCVAASGNAKIGCPDANARTQTTSDLRVALQQLSDGTRLLLRRGDTFTFDPVTNEPSQNWSNVVIGAYGPSCLNPDERGNCANAPKIKTSTSSTLFPDGHDVTIMDLQFEAVGSQPVHFYETGGQGGTTRHTLLRLASDFGFDTPIRTGKSGPDYYGMPLHEQVFYFDNRISNFTNYVFIGGGDRLAFIGNHFSGSRSTTVLRIVFSRRCIVGNNEINDPVPTRPSIKFHGEDFDWKNRYAEKIVVSDNKIRNKSDWMTVFGPQNVSSKEYIRDVIIERNTIIADQNPNASAPSTSEAVRVHVHNATIRNNVIYSTGPNMYGFVVGPYGRFPNPMGVEIYHNSGYAPDQAPSADDFSLVWTDGHSGPPIPVDNNILYAPNFKKQRIKECFPSSLCSSGNSIIPDPNNPGAFLSSNWIETQNPYLDPLNFDFRLRSGVQAKNSGTPSPVIEDFLGIMRNLATPSSGAYE